MESKVLDELREAAENPRAEVMKWLRVTGRPVVAVLPAYFPEPLVHAAGAFPVGMWGNTLPLGASDSYLQSFSCSIARSILELALKPESDFIAGFIFTSMCDNFETLAEVFKLALPRKPVFTFVIPNTSHLPSRRPYLERELDRALAFLSRVAGKRPSPEDYARSAKLYGEFVRLVREFYRHRALFPAALSNYDFYAVLKASFFMPKEEFNPRLRSLLEDLDRVGGEGARVLLSGIVPQPLSLLKVFDAAGTRVVGDDFAGAYRLFSKEPAAALLGSEIDKYLLSGAPCSTLHRDGQDRGKYLAARVRELGADGFVNWHIKFCEPEAFDRPHLLDELRRQRIPTLVLEVETSSRNFDALRTRLEAFVELIRQEKEKGAVS